MLDLPVKSVGYQNSRFTLKYAISRLNGIKGQKNKKKNLFSILLKINKKIGSRIIKYMFLNLYICLHGENY